MAAQAEAGHEVAYFCAGRRLPRLSRPRIHRWRRGRVTMYEVLNPPVPHGGDRGTRVPHLELNEPHTESLFGKVLARVRPDIVHLQELAGLPSSLIDVAKDGGFPLLMTLQDYNGLCPTLKLYDWQGEVCLRAQPGTDCRRCCREGSVDASHHADQTVAVALVELGRRYPRAKHIYRERIAPALWRILPARSTQVDPGPLPPRAEEYDKRREVNVARLSRVDALLAMSSRVADIYQELGVSGDRLRTLHLTLDHLEGLKPRHLVKPPRSVVFGTLNGANSPQKGSGVLLDALCHLEELGYGDRFRLRVHGAVDQEFTRRVQGMQSVEVESMYDASRLGEILDGIDVGIVPSIWEEAYGYVGIEFLAKGIPVLGNAIGGITDYTVPNVTGWLNESLDGAGLATLMAGIIDSPEQIVELHRGIVERREELVKPLERHREELDGIYQAVAAGSATNHER